MFYNFSADALVASILGDAEASTSRPTTKREHSQSDDENVKKPKIEEVEDEEKLAKFNQSFKKLTDLTVSVLSKSISSIQIGDTVVSDQKHIDEFIANTDKDFFKEITKHLESERDKFSLEPIKVTSTPEDIEAGAPPEWEIPITFDQSNFFE